MKLSRMLITGAFLAAAVVLSGCPPGKVAYQLGETVAVLPPSFYAGQEVDGSNVSGRQAFLGQSSNDGDQIAFWGLNSATGNCAFFVVDVDDPSSYRRITPEYPGAVPTAALSWTPDDSALLVAGYRIAIPPVGELSNFVSWPIHGVIGQDACTTSLSSGNWEIAQRHDNEVVQIVALPIRPDGSQDSLRRPIFLTNFSGATLRPDWVAVSRDATQVAFADIHDSVDGIQPDVADVYVLKNIPAILSAPLKPGTNTSSLAPMDATDPNVVPIRVGESVNFAETPAFSSNGKLLLYSEDFNNVFTEEHYFESFVLGDFDLMISNANGTGEDFRIAQPGCQVFPSSIPGGNRIVYNSMVGSAMHLFVSTLQVADGKGLAQ